jgi:bifunctional N-acetylglucosamine-1-phosphate-uridyltransferase/glucosamine-1-phosphate-acetyltransferase GlmU-like protein
VIVPIAAHKLGPVHAVLSALTEIDLSQPVVINYADFTCRWSFKDFSSFVQSQNVDAAVPAYRGFHPHSGGTTNYAYIREVQGRLLEMREKQPFTENKVEEFASSGTYYFKSGRLMKQFLQEQISKQVTVGGEYYVSSAVDLVAQAGLNVAVYEIEHFMQWGTPQDLGEYLYWSELFRQLSNSRRRLDLVEGIEYLGVLAGGMGARFKQVGYGVHKSLLKISGRTILEQALKVSNARPHFLAVESSEVARFISENQLGDLVAVDSMTDGQARSAMLLVENSKPTFDESITVVPSDTMYLDEGGALSKIITRESGDFFTVWVTNPTPFSKVKPENFAWIGQVGGVLASAFKCAPDFENPKIVSGAFTFSSREVFDRLSRLLIASGMQVNSEFYLDSLILIAEQEGIQVKTFEPTLSISLGTPYEFETYRYWQSCFDRWPSHPYSLDLDPFVSKTDITSVRAELAHTNHRPNEWS